MTLREGVRFHGGEEFTAADVAATIERTLDKAAAGVSYNVFGPVRAVQTEGKYKLWRDERTIWRIPGALRTATAVSCQPAGSMR